MEHCPGKIRQGQDKAYINVIPAHQLLVDKKVWDPDEEGWVSSITKYGEEELFFKIKVKNNGHENLTHAILKDILPKFLQYNDDADPYHDYYNSTTNIIKWNLSTMNPNETAIIKFNATITSLEYSAKNGYNIANVTSDQKSAEDSVEITATPHLTMEKTVWNGTNWTELLPPQPLGENVRFKIEFTYFGENPVKCMKIEDYLPKCLEYVGNEEYNYPNPEQSQDPNITTENISEGTKIIWDWEPAVIHIENGQSFSMEFDTTIAEYNQKENTIVENLACVTLRTCYSEVYHACDKAKINCTSPPSEFIKKVKDPSTNEWVDETDSSEPIVEGTAVDFKLELTYYGAKKLNEIRFYDEMPCCIEYKDGSASTNPDHVSDDNKKIWWNISENLTDGETITITFQAIVTGGSGCNEAGCSNFAKVEGLRKICTWYESLFNLTDAAKIYTVSNAAPCSPDIEGPNQGVVGGSSSFTAISEDADGDTLQYRFRWGDGETSTWGSNTQSHSWDSKGTYQIEAQAKDTHDKTSG
ncbi:MAG: PKD domain-containing protein, partial [Candidatus Thermoplasmatota archaeon]